VLILKKKSADPETLLPSGSVLLIMACTEVQIIFTPFLLEASLFAGIVLLRMIMACTKVQIIFTPFLFEASLFAGIVLLKNRAVGDGKHRLPLNPLLLRKASLRISMIA
jgi:hypothetical protein